MRAAKNPSSASTFIALPPLQLLRKSPRRSSSASVSGSFWVKVFMGNHPHEAAFVSASILRGIHSSEPSILSSRVPIQSFLHPRRTPLFQCPQQPHDGIPRQHQPSVLRLQKSLLHRMVEHRQQRSVIPQDIQDTAGLRMQTELRPSYRLAELLQSPEPTRQRDEGVRQVGHERLAFVHRVHNVKLRQPLVPDLAPHKVFGDDSHRLAARPQHRVREHTHQTHIAAAVHQANVASHQFRSHILGGSAVLRAAAGTGTAENADSSHLVILSLDPSAFIAAHHIHAWCTSERQSDTNLALLRSSVSSTRKDGAIKMIRKIALRLVAATLIAFVALNAYLTINRLRLIQKSAALTLESSTIQANISAVLQALTDMETSQRGYLLTGDSDYLLPYADGKNRIGTDFA